MAGEVKNLLIGFIIFGLFATLIISSVSIMGRNYNVDSTNLDTVTQGAFDMEDYEAEMQNADASENLRERFESGKINDIDDTTGIFSILSDTWSFITTPFLILANVGQNILGIPAIVTNTILTIVGLLIILGVWSIIRSGS